MASSSINSALFVIILTSRLFAAQDPTALTLERMGELESKRDPKCFATAVRVEDFMFGTPLTETARELKNELQRKLITNLWREASRLTKSADPSATELRLDQLRSAMARLQYKKRDDGGYEVRLPEGKMLLLSTRDVRHYFNIAYALRAILSVQQEALLANDPPLPFNKECILELEALVNVHTLATLSLADQAARLANEFEISPARFESAWLRVSAPATSAETMAIAKTPEKKFDTIHKLVAQKVASFEAYNQLSNQVFLRNIQVYFARHKWANEEEESKLLKGRFMDALIAFTLGLWEGSEQLAKQRQHAFLRQEDVADFTKRFIPHRANEYEDIIFFPNLPESERVVIEAYDLDSFRDSGIHWRYLQFAIEHPEFKGSIEPDPFAAELLTENIAQFGVLVFREMGVIAKKEDAPNLLISHVDKAIQVIQGKIFAHAKQPSESKPEERLPSSRDQNDSSALFFSDVTQKVGLNYEHRMADWLNRLLRSYTLKEENLGSLAIPPAFGGSGIAADDLDGDGDPDLLLLGGLGNSLFRNHGKGGFEAVANSGLDHVRSEDNQPGEPRQPLLADFDNDGVQDILITYVNQAHRLYKGLGDMRYQDVTAKSGLGGENLVGGPATTFDFDGDGLLDLYITYFGDYVRGVLPTIRRDNVNGLPNKLFRNKGNFQFEDVSAGSGTEGTGWSQAVTHTDFDGDGLQDLIVGNDFGFDNYYRGLGKGRFEEVREKIRTAKPNYTMGIGLADLNRDRYPEVYISGIVTLNKDEKYVAPNLNTQMKMNPEKLAQMRVVEANDLFMSQVKDGKFDGYHLSKAVKRGASSTGWAWDADFFDFDNDGDDDLYCLNGHNVYNVYNSEHPYFQISGKGQGVEVLMPSHQVEANVFFVNRDGSLWNESEQSGANLEGNSRSASYLDFDGDGDLDIALNNFQQAATFYENHSERFRRNWLKVRLKGDPKQGVSRDAIGARVEVKAGDWWNWREVRGSIGYMSVDPKQLHFGLGQAEKPELIITWPNGKRQVHKNLTVNKSYVVDLASGEISAL